MPQLRGQPQEDRNHKDMLYHLQVSCLSLERIRAKTEIYCKVTIYESLSIISVNLPVKYQINDDDIAAYRLSSSDAIYCQSVINPNTGLVSKNELDSASDDIMRVFNSLYQCYAKTLAK